MKKISQWFFDYLEIGDYKSKKEINTNLNYTHKDGQQKTCLTHLYGYFLYKKNRKGRGNVKKLFYR